MAMLPYAAAFDSGIPTFVYNRERIFRRDKNYKFSGAVHEVVTPRGNILYSDAAIFHKKIKENEPMRNLRILQKQIADGVQLDERQKFYYGRELLFNKMYLESAAVLEDFLNGNGWSVNKTEACVNLYQAYKALNDERALPSLLKSFLISPPSAQVCCILGENFMDKGEWDSAIYWYNAALTAPSDEKQGGFFNRDYCGFIPYMQLCVLYDKKGEYAKAEEYNEMAGKIKPGNVNFLSNKKYFANLKAGK
ncbi:MAG: glycosyl transferase, partial [Clostridia bacterium]|nr:glycosyl transferase [Clostridia bacterium]